MLGKRPCKLRRQPVENMPGSESGFSMSFEQPISIIGTARTFRLYAASAVRSDIYWKDVTAGVTSDERRLVFDKVTDRLDGTSLIEWPNWLWGTTDRSCRR